MTAIGTVKLCSEKWRGSGLELPRRPQGQDRPAAKPHCQSNGGRTAQRRHTIPPETMMNCQGRQFSNPASSGKRAWTIGILLRSRMPRRGS
jgi:hypothetical protein